MNSVLNSKPKVVDKFKYQFIEIIADTLTDHVFRSEYGEQNRYYFNHIEVTLSNARNQHLVFEK